MALRGSSDFESVAAYQHWMDELVDRRNASRQTNFIEERTSFEPCRLTGYPTITNLPCRVNKYGLARVGKSTYSLPATARA